MGWHSIYIHIPYCESKCNYCDFLSFPLVEAVVSPQDYVELLKQEMVKWPALTSPGSLYVGGGTPTVLPAELLADLIYSVCAYFNLRPDAEITVEANPGTVDFAYLQKLKEAGCNRVSLGAQSFCDAELAAMGRTHRAKQIYEAVEAAHLVGFDNVSLDLIYGLPGQLLEGWQKNLQQALALDVEHLSLYGLSLSSKSPWGKLKKEGRLTIADSDLSADMLALAREILPKAGYLPYEIANFAKAGYASRHNTAYWHRQDYLGLGVAAASCRGNCRWQNKTNLGFYAQALLAGLRPPSEIEALDAATVLAEAVFLGLRLAEGIDPVEIELLYGQDMELVYAQELAHLQLVGLLQKENGRWRLTERGIFLGNVVFQYFLP